MKPPDIIVHMVTAGINCGASSLHKTTQTKLCSLIFQKKSDSMHACLCARAHIPHIPIQTDFSQGQGYY